MGDVGLDPYRRVVRWGFRSQHVALLRRVVQRDTVASHVDPDDFSTTVTALHAMNSWSEIPLAWALHGLPQ